MSFLMIELKIARRIRVTRVCKITAAGILLAALTAALGSCKDKIADPSTSPIVFPASNISYSTYIDPLFQQRCALSGCHTTNTPSANLDLTPPSYYSVINHQPRLVTAGASANSLLVQRINGQLLPQMPTNLPPLTTNQITGIKKWIDEGAKNN